MHQYEIKHQIKLESIAVLSSLLSNTSFNLIQDLNVRITIFIYKNRLIKLENFVYRPLFGYL